MRGRECTKLLYPNLTFKLGCYVKMKLQEWAVRVKIGLKIKFGNLHKNFEMKYEIWVKQFGTLKRKEKPLKGACGLGA